MENPRVVGRFVMTLLAAFAATAVGGSIYYREWSFLVSFLCVAGLFFFACVLLALTNLAAFAPIFWLLGRFNSKNPDGKSPGWENPSGKNPSADDLTS